MGNVTRHTGFKDKNSMWHIRPVSIPVDVNNHATPLWPKFFNAWGALWECCGASQDNTKLFYKETNELNEEHIPEEQNQEVDNEEYIDQLEDHAGRQEKLIKEQAEIIRRLTVILESKK